MKNILVTILIASSCISYAQKALDHTRTARFTYDVSPNDRVVMGMKNTKLTLIPWTKEEIALEAVVKCKVSPNERQQKLLDNWANIVEGKIEKSGSTLTISSGFDERNIITKKSFFGLIVRMTISNDDDMEVEYLMKVPIKTAYEIKGSYEDIEILGDMNDLSLYLYSANLKAQNISKANLELRYGRATIGSLEEAKITLYENDLEASALNDASFDLKYSMVNFENAQKCRIDGYESDLIFNDVGILSGNLKYGDIEIKSKMKEGVLYLYEAKIKAENIDELMLNESKYSKIMATKVNQINIASSYEDELDIMSLNSLQTFDTKYGKYEIGKLNQSLELIGYEDEITIKSISNTSKEISINGKYIKTSLILKDVAFSLDATFKYGKLIFDEQKVNVNKYNTEGLTTNAQINTLNHPEPILKISIEGYEMDTTLEH